MSRPGSSYPLSHRSLASRQSQSAYTDQRRTIGTSSSGSSSAQRQVQEHPDQRRVRAAPKHLKWEPRTISTSGRTAATGQRTCDVRLSHLSYDKADKTGCEKSEYFMGCHAPGNKGQAVLKVAVYANAVTDSSSSDPGKGFEVWALGKCSATSKKTTWMDPTCDDQGVMLQEFEIPINCTAS